MSQPFTLVGLDIEGEWNRPLIENAAAISGCGCIFAKSGQIENTSAENPAADSPDLQSVLGGFRSVIACEPIRKSVSIYDLPAPRSKTAVIVGNEKMGIPRKVLNQAEAVACVPMADSRLSSINVAVAASIILYALTRDLGRRHTRRTNLRQSNVDLLVHGPTDPHEIGSLLRSAYAFGWRRAFISDPHGVWFTKDPEMILASRAAARRANNLLAVLPADQLDLARYDAVLKCDGRYKGAALSRLQLPQCRRLLVVIGPSDLEIRSAAVAGHVTVDVGDASVPVRARHSGSILLSVVSQMLAT